MTTMTHAQGVARAAEPQPRSPQSSHQVATTVADTIRAWLLVHGQVSAAAVGDLAAAIQAHLKAGRRFLRINLAAVPDLDAELLALLEQTHDLLLARRGTLILTGVHGALMAQLRRTGLDRVFFVLAPTAEESLAEQPALGAPR